MKRRRLPTSESRLADRSLVLTVATLILLTPPIVAIFDVPVGVFGIPVLHVYCFAVWLAAIVLGGRINTRLAAHDHSSSALQDLPGLSHDEA